MKTIIVGSSHAGIAAANTLLSALDQEVTLIDSGSNISYLGSGSALWLGHMIEDYQDLFYTQAKDLQGKGAEVLLNTKVTQIDFAEKQVHTTNSDGLRATRSYDKLILATGSNPISPNIPGHDLEGIHFVKTFEQAQAVDEKLKDPSIKRIAVIGAGYIGVEIAEALARRNKEVLVFDALDSCLATYYDPDFAKMMNQTLLDHGLKLYFNELATAYEGKNGVVNRLITNKGQYDVDLIINAIGFSPNTALGKEHLDCFKNGAYLVDKHHQTSDPDVYAVGDCATIYSTALREPFYIALASNAIRSGIIAGKNILGHHVTSPGVQGSNAIQIFGLNMVSTGFSQRSCERFGLKVAAVDYQDTQKPSYIKDNGDVKIRIVYEEDSRRIVGAQLASTVDISMIIHMFSLAIEKEVTIDELQFLDLFYLPHLNKAFNYIALAANKAN